MRDGAFEQQLHGRLELAEQDKRNAVELAQAKRDRVAVAELGEANLTNGLLKGARLEFLSGVAMKPIGQKVVISRCVGRAGLGDTQKYSNESTTYINRKRLFRAIAMKTSNGLELPVVVVRAKQKLET